MEMTTKPQLAMADATNNMVSKKAQRNDAIFFMKSQYMENKSFSTEFIRQSFYFNRKYLKIH